MLNFDMTISEQTLIYIKKFLQSTATHTQSGAAQEFRHWNQSRVEETDSCAAHDSFSTP